MVKLNVNGAVVEISEHAARSIDVLTSVGFGNIEINDDIGILAKPHTLIPHCSYNARDETLCIGNAYIEVSLDRLTTVFDALCAAHYTTARK